MSDPSTSSSTSAVDVSVGSTSSELAATGKRKAASRSSSPQTPPSRTVDAEEPQQPPIKKVKKPLEKKVSVWKDLNLWKEGDDPLGRFPLEVLDLIRSVDSDLDLRDHLALAATCRYFRTCYRDVVFQVLFQGAFPTFTIDHPDINVDYSGLPSRYRTRYPVSRPFDRSFNDGRHIFSSGRSLVGSGGWAGWGLSRVDFDANKKEADERKEVLERVFAAYWDERPMEVSEFWSRTEARLQQLHPGDPHSRETDPRWSERVAEEALQARTANENNLRDVHGLEQVFSDRTLDPLDIRYGSRRWIAPTPLYDPWPSVWRSTITEIVNRPKINKSAAKLKYNISDRDLLSIRLLPELYRRKKVTRYFEAAVQALSLRSHGGGQGHAQHLAKLAERKLRRDAAKGE